MPRGAGRHATSPRALLPQALTAVSPRHSQGSASILKDRPFSSVTEGSAARAVRDRVPCGFFDAVSRSCDRLSRPRTLRRVPLDGAPMRVPVVEDDQNAALAMAAYLSLENIEARAVSGGMEAIDTGREWAPHVILMDIWMPNFNGF